MSYEGVSVTFFCSAIRCLEKQYGGKMCAEGVEDFRAALATAEAAYKRLPDVPKKGKRNKLSS